MSVMARILAKSAAEPRRVTHVRAFAFEPRTPPAEIQLWNAGDNATDYGVHKWTARSAADVTARYESRGNPLLIDVEHNGANSDDAEPTTTGGYARLEIRSGAPWLVFDWSAYAVEQIQTGQRRFLSPEYDVDKITGEILALYRVSLVADPGTHRARMLAAAHQQETGMDPKLAAIMAILSSVADPAAAIESIKSLVANLDGGDPVDPAEAAAPAEGEGAPLEASAPDAPESDKDKVAAAAPAAKVIAPVAAVKAAVAATPDASVHVHVAAAAAVVQIENAQRDHLLATQGDRLDTSIRRWASAQPLAVVRGLIDATPAKQDPLGRVAATRGATHGAVAANGLQGAELEELDRAMGTFKATSLEPHTTAAGVLVLPAVPPSVHRERKRVAAAAALVAGKVGS